MSESMLHSYSGPPLVVRAHHANILHGMYRDAYPPTVAAYLLRKRVQQQRDSAYEADVLGTTQAESDRAVAGFAKFFQTFIGLPNDAPVEFTSRKKDGICASCIQGAHCAIPQPTAHDEDTKWLTALHGVAETLGLPVAPTVKTSATSLKGTQIIPTSLTMEARDARTVLAHPLAGIALEHVVTPANGEQYYLALPDGVRLDPYLV